MRARAELITLSICNNSPSSSGDLHVETSGSHEAGAPNQAAYDMRLAWMTMISE